MPSPHTGGFGSGGFVGVEQPPAPVLPVLADELAVGVPVPELPTLTEVGPPPGPPALLAVPVPTPPPFAPVVPAPPGPPPPPEACAAAGGLLQAAGRSKRLPRRMAPRTSNRCVANNPLFLMPM